MKATEPPELVEFEPNRFVEGANGGGRGVSHIVGQLHPTGTE